MTNNHNSLGKNILDAVDISSLPKGNVDIVFVINATTSMQPIIDTAKNSALNFYTELKKKIEERKRFLYHVRIKIIWFRDFYHDGDKAYGESVFFKLPDESYLFRNFIENIPTDTGGDTQSGLEALSMAMRSDFTQEGTIRRHIIVLFTDAGAYKLEDYDSLAEEASKKGCVAPTIYPENMPRSLTELTTVWYSKTSDFAPNLDYRGRRLILFAPNAYPWMDIEMEWDFAIRENINSESGGAEIEMEELNNFIAASLSGMPWTSI